MIVPPNAGKEGRKLWIISRCGEASLSLKNI